MRNVICGREALGYPNPISSSLENLKTKVIKFDSLPISLNSFEILEKM